MGAPLTRLIIEQLVRYGLEDLHNRPSLINMIFEKFSWPVLAKQYGAKEIESIKNHVIGNKIAVVQAFPLVAEKVPCYSIQVIGTDEDSTKAFFDDKAEDEQTEAEAATLLSLAPLSYDAVTGFIECATGTDFSSIYVGAIFLDQAGSMFEIIGPILDNKFAIAPQSNVVLGANCRVISEPNWDTASVHESPLIERIQIGVHAGENTNSCDYLTYILMYILQSRRLELENVGIQVHTFGISDFVRNLEFLPSNVINRFVNFNAKVWFRWKDDPYRSTGVSEIADGIQVDKDVWVKSGDYTVTTTE